MIDKKKQGKNNRIQGAIWERKVREDLESKGWFVSKSEINVDLENQKIVPAKASRYRLKSTGLPDFIAWEQHIDNLYQIIGVEAKSNGYLTKEEKAKFRFMLKNKVFSKIYIVKKKKEGRKIVPEYINFQHKYS